MALHNTYNLHKKAVENAMTVEESARLWRNQELKKSDWIIKITDHPERASYLTYRASLRDWPTTDDFPNTKPTL